MSTKENEVNEKPYPLELADALDANADLDAAEGGNPTVCKLERDAAALLRTQHAAIERKDALLRKALKALEHCHASEPIWKTPRIEAVDAITKELQ